MLGPIFSPAPHSIAPGSCTLTDESQVRVGGPGSRAYVWGGLPLAVALGNGGETGAAYVSVCLCLCAALSDPDDWVMEAVP